MHISVIIPALNERDALPETLARVAECLPGQEVLVADGGSTDGTQEYVEAYPGVRLVRAERGRGPQMNAGARAASGQVLLFLHADCLLPDDADATIRNTLRDLSVVGGAFQVSFSEGELPALHRLAWLINLRSCSVSEATGDQAIFVRRAVFETAGGFPSWPLFEDLALTARLKRLGQFQIAPAFVTISARRWLAHGVLRTSLLMCLLYGGYRLGVAPATLKRWFVDVRPRRN